MINAKELRIGNWVRMDYDIVQVNPEIFDLIINKKYPLCSPIPITHDILINCSIFCEYKYFYEFPEHMVDYDLKIMYDTPAKNYRLVYGDNMLGCKAINHLHQLQNLFFALVGDELNYKP